MENVKALGKTICEALLLDPDNCPDETKQAFEKQQNAIKSLREMKPEEKKELLSSTSSRQFTVRTLMKIDAIRELITDIEHHHQSVDDGGAPASHAMNKIIADSRKTCQIHRLPRPGTEKFFGLVELSSAANDKESGKRRARDEDDDKSNDEENQKKASSSALGLQLQRELFGLDKPVVDGITFISLVSGVAYSLKKNGKLKQLLQQNNVVLKSEKDIQQNNNDSNNSSCVAYRICHLVVTLLLNLMRRIQCYSQCQFDLQSKIEEAKRTMKMKEEEEDKEEEETTQESTDKIDEKKTELTSSSISSTASSVKFVRQALERISLQQQHQRAKTTTEINSQEKVLVPSSSSKQRKMTLEQEAEVFLRVDSDPTISQKTFHQSGYQDKVIKVMSEKNDRVTLTLKMIGNLEGSRTAVCAAVDSMK